MILITIKVATYFQKNGEVENHTEMFEHYLYEGTLVQFLIEYEQDMARTDAKYRHLGMKGWFTLVNTSELGGLSSDEVNTLLKSVHFGCQVFNAALRTN